MIVALAEQMQRTLFRPWTAFSLFRVREVGGDGSPGGEPVPADLLGRDHSIPTEPSEEAGAQTAALRRLRERDESLFRGSLPVIC